MKLNLCSGEVNLTGYVNIDMVAATHPDVILDIRSELLPYDNESVDEVRVFHGMEHIERKYWDFVFMECCRVLTANGQLILGYPELTTCVKNFVEDKDNVRAFWLNCLYGRQDYPGDYHVTAMHTPELRYILESYGFYRIKAGPESTQDYYYSIMVAYKDPSPVCREEIVAQQVGLGQGVSIECV